MCVSNCSIELQTYMHVMTTTKSAYIFKIETFIPLIAMTDYI